MSSKTLKASNPRVRAKIPQNSEYSGSVIALLIASYGTMRADFDACSKEEQKQIIIALDSFDDNEIGTQFAFNQESFILAITGMKREAALFSFLVEAGFIEVIF